MASNKRKRKQTVQGQATPSKARRTASNTNRGPRQPRRLIITSANTTRRSFADLPGELRNIIYERALLPTYGRPIRLTGGGDVGDEIALSLLGACKAIRAECGGIFYGMNTFRFDVHCVTDWERKMDHPLNPLNSLRNLNRRWELLYPEVWDTLDRFGTKRIKQMRSFLFVYHSFTLYDKMDPTEARRCLPDSGDVSVLLQLNKTAPCYDFSVEMHISSDQRKSATQKIYRGLFEEFQDDWSFRCVHALARRDVFELAGRCRVYFQDMFQRQ